MSLGAGPSPRRGVRHAVHVPELRHVLSIGIFFWLMIAGLAASLPKTLTAGLTAQGVPLARREDRAPASGLLLFAAFLGYNPMKTSSRRPACSTRGARGGATLAGRTFFPTLMSGPFMHGLMIVFTAAALMALIGAAVRGCAAGSRNSRRRPSRRPS